MGCWRGAHLACEYDGGEWASRSFVCYATMNCFLFHRVERDGIHIQVVLETWFTFALVVHLVMVH
jgi:hypothetical protein